ncbi:MAG: T9SS type A sorting domain-containing protein [Melioribacteraceae bacterium]|nr:MAG: T9SS type A sorting domain-containing protein [Melioribacteraceae bacterium]
MEKLDLNPNFSFTPFDTWTRTSPGSDDIVDLVIIVYRDFPNSLIFGSKWTGYSSIWLPAGGYYSVVDQKKIIGGFGYGSGVQMRGAHNGLDYSVFQAAHEFGHKLFGTTGHIKFGLANLSLMGDSPVWNSSRGMCAWEREKLGWIDYIVKEDDEIFELQDYFNEDEAVKIKLPNTDIEYFILENRQKIVKDYDLAGAQGIYSYHVKGGDQMLPEYMDVECADGNFKWHFDETTLKVTKLHPDPFFGNDEMDYQIKFDSDGDGEQEIYGCFIEGGYIKDAAWGDYNDAFDEKYNNVFSPTSNPPSTNGVNHPFTVEILENKNGLGVYKIQLHYNNAYAGKPSKPFGVVGHTHTYGSNGSTSARAFLDWSDYWDDDHDEWEVYRAVASVNGPKPDLSDYEFVTNAIQPSMTPRINVFDYGDDKKIYYRIKARDKEGKRSTFSDPISDWAPPETPIINITRSFSGHPVVSWDEPKSDDLEVFLRKKVGDEWEDPIKMTGTHYEDLSVDWPVGHLVNEADFYYYTYKQRRSNLQSPQSEVINAWGEGEDWLYKNGSEYDAIPKIYDLSQNYPNPFNPSSIIKYQLPSDSHVSLIVYDILGKEVVELINEHQSAGYYFINFDGSFLSSGMYIYRIIAGNYIDSKKMLLLK